MPSCSASLRVPLGAGWGRPQSPPAPWAPRPCSPEPHGRDTVSASWRRLGRKCPLEGISGRRAQPLPPGGRVQPDHSACCPRADVCPARAQAGAQGPVGGHRVPVTRSMDTCHIPLLSGATSPPGCCAGPTGGIVPSCPRLLRTSESCPCSGLQARQRGDPGTPASSRLFAPEMGFRDSGSSSAPAMARRQGGARRRDTFLKRLYLELTQRTGLRVYVCSQGRPANTTVEFQNGPERQPLPVSSRAPRCACPARPPGPGSVYRAQGLQGFSLYRNGAAEQVALVTGHVLLVCVRERPCRGACQHP